MWYYNGRKSLAQGVKEKFHELNFFKAEDVPIGKGIAALFKNKYWIMMTCVLALFFLYYAINGGTTVYYAKTVLGNEDLVGTINGIYNAI